jgi:vacuolar protein sorting-associated protein 29
LQVVQGDFDEVGAWPVNKTISHGDYKFGLTHGHQIIPFGDRASLAAYARQLDVDVLISGHTHQLEIRKEDGRLFVNPGTVTGAESQFGGEPFPSFMLMDVQDTITIYIYIYKDGGYIVQTEKYSKD